MLLDISTQLAPFLDKTQGFLPADFRAL
jgi:hypothetical protein